MSALVDVVDDRARDVLGYSPRHSSLEALRESLRWLIAEGQIDAGGQTL